MLFAPALVVRSVFKALIPSRTLRWGIAAGLLLLTSWNTLPDRAAYAHRFDVTTHRVWQLVEVGE